MLAEENVEVLDPEDRDRLTQLVVRHTLMTTETQQQPTFHLLHLQGGLDSTAKKAEIAALLADVERLNQSTKIALSSLPQDMH